MYKIENLKESELLELKSEIDNQLKIIEQDKFDIIKQKNDVKNKTQLSQLVQNDSIFGIGFSSNGLGVYFMGYCDVRNYTVVKGSNYDDISVGHKTEPFGISTSIRKERTDKSYCLFFCISSVYFFTLKPETWQGDMQEALSYQIKQKRKQTQRDIKNLKKEVGFAIKDCDKINNYISDNCL